MHRSPARVLSAVLVAAALVALGGPAAAGAAARPAPRLLPFRSCAALLSYAHAGALKAGGTTGVPLRATGVVNVVAPPAPAPGSAEGSVSAPQVAPSTSDSPSFSTTNVQEQGVDEPDVVKTDGHYVYLVTASTLRVVDASGATPRVVGTLALDGYGQQLLLRGKRLLVTATGAGAVGMLRQAPSIAYQPGYGTTLLTEVDVSDPVAPKVARSMTVDGDFVDARLTGGTARVVIGSAPDPIVAAPQSTLARAVARTTAARFVPRTVLHSAISGRTFRRPIAKCTQVRHPRAFSGTGLLTVMTIDLDRGLYSVDRDALMEGAQTVYGSPTSLYVASQKYSPALEDGRAIPSGSTTQIDRFDASRDGVTSYRSSGEVPGFVLNSLALSEDGGYLRVATTQEPLWFPGPTGATGPAVPSSSAVTVLGEQDGRLLRVGSVGDLGRGEKIYAVRFAGDRAYVVTFRQIDPLYVIDLSVPSAPRVRGHLDLTGYSAYLHPLGGDRLLGVGQEATAEGRRAGSQVSLFDVSDPAAPRLLQRKLLGQGSSSVEFDPHAFLWWPATRLAVLPLSTYDPATGSSSFALGLHVSASAITEAGRVTHEAAGGGQASIDRSFVIGDSLYTLSYAGLAKSGLGDFALQGFVAFPQPASPGGGGGGGVVQPAR